MPPASEMTVNPREAVLRRIKNTCDATHRSASEVNLLAVSKLHPAEAVRVLYAQGQRAFGENYVQEGVDKIAALADLPDIEWHMIGPLQSNKTREVAEHFDWVHTVEREKIAVRLNDQRPAHLPPLNVCVQVNISGEASKSGCAVADAVGLARAVSALPRLRLRGLMGMAAPGLSERETRAQFAVLRDVLRKICAEGTKPEDFTDVMQLSMGMSDDLEWAIAEGATMVRVGTALFGARAG